MCYYFVQQKIWAVGCNKVCFWADVGMVKWSKSALQGITVMGAFCACQLAHVSISVLARWVSTTMASAMFQYCRLAHPTQQQLTKMDFII